MMKTKHLVIAGVLAACGGLLGWQMSQYAPLSYTPAANPGFVAGSVFAENALLAISAIL